MRRYSEHHSGIITPVAFSVDGVDAHVMAYPSEEDNLENLLREYLTSVVKVLGQELATIKTKSNNVHAMIAELSEKRDLLVVLLLSSRRS